MVEPIMVLQKNTDKDTNKIRIPKAIVEKWGRQFYLKIYTDRIEIIPIRKEK